MDPLTTFLALGLAPALMDAGGGPDHGVRLWRSWKEASPEEVLDHVEETCPHGRGEEHTRDARYVLPPEVVGGYRWFGPGDLPLDHPMFRQVYPCSMKDVEKYARKMRRGSLPPAVVILVDNDGQHEDRFFVQDGAHRVAAAIRVGMSTIPAYVGERPWSVG